MTEYTKCEGIGCPLKQKCYRFTAPSDGEYQSWSGFYKDLKETENGVECDYFIPIGASSAAPAKRPKSDQIAVDQHAAFLVPPDTEFLFSDELSKDD